METAIPRETAEQAYRRFAAGDDTALAAVIAAYEQPLARYLFSYMRNEDEVDDLLSEVFYKLVLHRGSFRGDSSLKTYLFGIARHEALARLRRLRRRPEIGLDDWDSLPDGTDPVEALIAAEQREWLKTALAQLPPHYREALHLAYCEGLSAEQSAAVMHCTRKQVENILYRAKGALKLRLEKEELSDENF